MFCFFFFKQKTAYEMRISDWSSDVCSSDLVIGQESAFFISVQLLVYRFTDQIELIKSSRQFQSISAVIFYKQDVIVSRTADGKLSQCLCHFMSPLQARSEEHTSELQSLIRRSYAVF